MGQTGHFHRLSQILADFRLSRVWDRRDFRRKPQETADFCRNQFLPFAVSLGALSYIMSHCYYFISFLDFFLLLVLSLFGIVLVIVV